MQQNMRMLHNFYFANQRSLKVCSVLPPTVFSVQGYPRLERFRVQQRFVNFANVF